MANPLSYPLPVFSFVVEWGGARVGFTEVSGLNREIQVIEYREGNNPEFHVTKMPGMQKFPDITLKRGMLSNDKDFNLWLTTVQMNTIERRTLKISLQNETGDPVFSWTIIDAFPIKAEWPGLKSTGNEVAIESLTLANEGILLIQ